MQNFKIIIINLLILIKVNQYYATFFENEYTLRYSHKNPELNFKITELKICGERNSGTCFLKALMEKNILEVNVHHVCSDRFGYKHFLWWFDTIPEPDQLQKLGYNKEAVTLEGSSQCLFIVIVRNPYDWLRSFYLSPQHVLPSLTDKGFFYFISESWHLKDRFEEIDGYNPYTGKIFSNLLELRNYKIKNYLRLGELVENYCFVRYEDLLVNQEEFVNFISEFYNLKKSEEFIPILTVRGVGNSIYHKKNYFELDEKSLDFINNNLNVEVEQKIGYYSLYEASAQPKKPY